RARMVQMATNTLAWTAAGDLEPEIDEGIEIIPREEGQNDESEGCDCGPNGVGRRRKGILLAAGLHQQIDEKQRNREEAKHEKRRGVFATEGEIRQSRQKVRRCAKRSGPEKCQAQTQDIESQNSLSPQSPKTSRALRESTAGGLRLSR